MYSVHENRLIITEQSNYQINLCRYNYFSKHYKYFVYNNYTYT